MEVTVFLITGFSSTTRGSPLSGHVTMAVGRWLMRAELLLFP